MSGGRRLVVVAGTRRGAEIAARLCQALPDTEAWLSERWAEHVPGARSLAAPLSVGLPGLFRDESVNGLVVILAVGATVRLLAPFLQGKDRDPAVVCVDDSARFAVALLGGHHGGANALATRVAGALGACAVITTASDSDGVLAVDLLGQADGWRIEATPTALRHAAAAIVNGDPVCVFQDAGDTGWQTAPNVPDTVHFVSDLRHSQQSAVLLVISDRLVDVQADPDRTVVYRPPTLVAGIGCSTGVSEADISEVVDNALARGRLARGSIARLATLDRRLDEPGVVAYARRLGLPLHGFAASALAAVPAIPNPSPVVQAAVGAPGVCEPAALLASGAALLVVPKVKNASATAAIARIV
jgi:cobalt-precorrin 5A hydrolase